MEIFYIAQDIVSSLRDLSDYELQFFAGLHEDPTNDVQIELFIYVCFLIFTRTGSVEYLEQARHWAEKWATATPEDSADQARRSDIFNMMSARIWRCRHGVGGLSYTK
jgi:hypothetical protein